MLTTQAPDLYIVNDPIKSRCIHTASTILEGSLIEICPVIILNNQDTLAIHKTLLHDYYFIWDIAEKTSAIALGYGSLYNHSDTPNAEFSIHKSDRSIYIHAISQIDAGEEITMDYIASKEEGYELWF